VLEIDEGLVMKKNKLIFLIIKARVIHDAAAA